MVKFLLVLTAFLLSNINVVTAQTAATVENKSCDRELLAFRSVREAPNLHQNNSVNSASKNSFRSRVSSNTLEPSIEANSDDIAKISVASIAVPSLWWAIEQFDPFGGRLIDDWLTYPQIKQIDLTVNWQLWTLLDYLGRYRFINQFGTVAREYGYSLRIFNQQQQCLALYEYNERTNPPKWEITIEGLGDDSLQVEPVEN